ncbi:collagen binding, ancillary pilus subunit Cne [Streptococcus equi subsp. zooepidemicus]|uniref:Cna B-type domain-containing protein n=1 Tax=Streptococcus equi TaxID=1336 RepID=UPI000DA3B6B6|nr:Cna B-type domain-containing protein [Streptococcus equi]SQF05364.1 collagen binding, ancillary pilus subunit Cne [Streptococcus equi subsp. zooepidemicus]HEL0619727.1 Cna B-type domain-containing protein [Streptococcus equi subsp. zooepidemicus]HEL0625249.1 Cna B-type domain-containing protein [Streptococcus equi subsp. zooepidemicus]HEL0735508.1 Cna B-type domain-containing protein [Streptococcus equi subsp. zooepidemicus]HEL1256104.1 Cna B-type domain-containing protein [Streptococcus eq
MKQLTKIVSVVLLLLLTLSASLPKVRATNISDNITSLTVASSSLRDGERTTVKVAFDDKKQKIKAGDTIEVTWPTSGNVYIQGFNKTIPLNIRGVDVGTLEVTLDKAVFTFNQNIETMHDVSGWGEFEITVRNVTQTTTETTGTTTVRVGNHTATINVTKPEAGTGTSSFYYKTGDMQPDDTDHVRWFLLINNNKEWVADTVTVEDDIQGGQTLDMSSFDITVSGYRNERFVGEKALEEFRQKFPYSTITADDKTGHIHVSLDKDDASKNTVNVAYKTKITDYDQKEFANNSKIWYQILYKDQVSGQESNHQVANVNANGGVDGSRYTSFTVKKIWNDKENQDGKRPKTITVQLYANDQKVNDKTIELSDTNSWQASFGKLDKYDSQNQKITYSVKEVTVPAGYQSQVEGDSGVGFTITNTYTPEVISITGQKTWDDKENQDGKRPKEITVRLLANNVATGDVTTASVKTGWKYTFTNLPKYKDGKQITYTIQEDSVADYTTTIQGFDITNHHEVALTSLKVIKAWNDKDDYYHKRPKEITISLKADGKVIREHQMTPDQQGKWEYTFDQLPVYQAGKKISYSIEEKQVDGYQAPVYDINEDLNQVTVTNTINQSYSLPDTGGQGVKWYLLIGGSIITVACLVLISLYQKHKHHNM